MLYLLKLTVSTDPQDTVQKALQVLELVVEHRECSGIALGLQVLLIEKMLMPFFPSAPNPTALFLSGD